jgi:TonB family protein
VTRASAPGVKPRVARATASTTGGGLLRAAAAGGVLAAGAALLVAAPGAGPEALAASGASRPAPATTQAPATPAVADSRHYPSNELDVRPGIMVRVNPAYPERAARENVSGKAVVRLYIDVNGAVERVEVERAAPAGYGFEDAAASAFRSARFSPAMKGGKRVRAEMRIEVSFDAPTAQPKR